MNLKFSKKWQKDKFSALSGTAIILNNGLRFISSAVCVEDIIHGQHGPPEAEHGSSRKLVSRSSALVRGR